ncbi:MAG: hypothetical protein FD161_60 [Limisphaerales bacterium]|nr:MAG: hypothetical protein FD161_60 [Limisphaerales bacterium]KAG0510506.1 MAG: hypothetical protein E1N63_60 [Limisphaerales bacterium]TXT52779.1 MAG: hypothetical protein FD140_322 [Limisphaerales bacterium]
MPAWSDLWSNVKRGDFKAATGDLFLDQETLDAGRRADDRLAQIAVRNRERGIYDDAQYALTLERLGYSNTDRYAGEVGQDFVSGAEEGLASMQRGVKDTLTSTAGFSLRAILGFVPWWAWLLLLIWALWQLGLLKRVLTKAS